LDADYRQESQRKYLSPGKERPTSYLEFEQNFGDKRAASPITNLGPLRGPAGALSTKKIKLATSPLKRAVEEFQGGGNTDMKIEVFDNKL